MIVKEHKLVKQEFQSGNRLGLQHYVECSCGFQGRLGTEQAAKSQFDNHLVYHGCGPYFSKLVLPEEESKQETSKTEWIPTVWIPEGAK
jgi:hypothetical protein